MRAVGQRGVAGAVLHGRDAAEPGQQPQVAAVGRAVDVGRGRAPAGGRARGPGAPVRSGRCRAGRRPEANWPPHHSSSTGCSRSHGSAALTSATASSNARRASATDSSSATPEASLGHQQVGDRRRPVAGVHRADRQRVGQRPAGHHRIDGLVAPSLEVGQGLPHRPEPLDGADPVGAAGGVGGPAVHAQPERQRTGVGRDHVQLGRLGDHAGVGRPAPPEEAERAHAAVLLALHRGQHDVARAAGRRTPAAPRTAHTAAISPAFMSQAPRPYSRPSRTVAVERRVAPTPRDRRWARRRCAR